MKYNRSKIAFNLQSCDQHQVTLDTVLVRSKLICEKGVREIGVNASDSSMLATAYSIEFTAQHRHRIGIGLWPCWVKLTAYLLLVMWFDAAVQMCGKKVVNWKCSLGPPTTRTKTYHQILFIVLLLPATSKVYVETYRTGVRMRS